MSDQAGTCDLMLTTILWGLITVVGTNTDQSVLQTNTEDQKLTMRESAKRVVSLCCLSNQPLSLSYINCTRLFIIDIQT